MTLLTKDPFVSAFDAIEFQIGDCAERTPQADRSLIVENLIAEARKPHYFVTFRSTEVDR